MNKINTVISFVLFIYLLTGVAHAVPDFYYYDNFIAGMSPFSVPTSIELDSSGYWEDYSPIQSNLGFVTSYDNVSMSGATPVSAVPAYDMDMYIGKQLRIPAGQAIVVYSSSGQNSDNRIIMSSSGKFFAMPLGTTAPTNISLDVGNTAKYYGSNVLFSDTTGTLAEFPYNWSSSSFPSEKYLQGIFSSNMTQLPVSFEGYSPYQYSIVYLLINYGDTDSYIWWNAYAGDIYELEGIPYEDISWVYVTSNTYVSTSTSSAGNYFYFVPHINGDFDLYSYTHSNSDLSEYYTYLSNYDYKITSIDFENSVAKNNYTSFVPITFGNTSGSSNARRVYYSTQLTNLPASSGLVPIFIHQYNATRYIDGKAIYIYDGYINVQNYDELVALLKENGYSGDLARVIELLDLINTGGATGAEVKELIDTIEGLENQIFDNFKPEEIKSVWDTYKSLLDFSSLNWLIVANNRMFEIFAGVIMLSAFFLILNRLMR